MRMIVRPMATIAPAIPPKISICRRRRSGPSPPGGAGGGGGDSGGTPGAVTVPEPHAPPGRCHGVDWVGTDMDPVNTTIGAPVAKAALRSAPEGERHRAVPRRERHDEYEREPRDGETEHER